MSSPSGGVPSPDLSAYTDLRLYDVTDQQIVEAAIGMLQLLVPGLTLREGHIETTLLEALALEQAEAIVAINRIPGAVVETILNLAGVDKDYGQGATATATITVTDTVGHTIPAGTRLYLPLSDGGAVTFLIEPTDTGGDAIIAPGASSVVVSLISSENTASGNGSPAGTVLVLADSVTYVESVILATSVADGRDPESDEEWRDRGVARLSRLSDALVVPRHFEAAADERAEVGRSLVLDNWDPGSGNAVGADPGHVTVCVLGDDGTALSTLAKAAIAAALDERAAAMLIVHVVDILITAVNVTAQITVLPGYDNATVFQSVKDALGLYLDPLTWAWGSTIRINELISLIDQVPGVDYVVSVQIQGSPTNYALPDARTVPDAGTLAVTL